MGIASNKKHPFLLKEINHLGWDHYFQIAIGAGHAEKDKPDAAPLKLALQEIDPTLKQDEVLYVGDTETDLMTAQNAKIPVAFIPSHTPQDDLINKYNPAFYGSSLAEVMKKALP